MRGPELEDAVLGVLCPALDGRATRARNGKPTQWTLRCPVHHGQRRNLSLTIENGRIVAHCHHKPPCTWEQIRDALNTISPGIVPRRRKAPQAIDRDALVALAKRSDLGDSARQLGILILAGFSADEGRAELGMSKSTYYRAMKELS